MVKPIILIAIFSLMMGMSSVALAKHKKKGHPKPTPTTTTRISNPVESPDPQHLVTK